MSEWMETEPPEGKLVVVRGSDCFGNWYGVAKKLTYKKKPFKGMKKDWRWTDVNGVRFIDQHVDAWRAYPGQ